jgi:hypothetical protein
MNHGDRRYVHSSDIRAGNEDVFRISKSDPIVALKYRLDKLTAKAEGGHLTIADRTLMISVSRESEEAIKT